MAVEELIYVGYSGDNKAVVHGPHAVECRRRTRPFTLTSDYFVGLNKRKAIVFTRQYSTGVDEG